MRIEEVMRKKQYVVVTKVPVLDEETGEETWLVRESSPPREYKTKRQLVAMWKKGLLKDELWLNEIVNGVGRKE